MGNKSLINESEAFNEDGLKLSRDFSSLIKDFISESCNKYNSTEVEYILSSELNCLCCEARILKSAKSRKKKRKFEEKREEDFDIQDLVEFLSSEELRG